MSRPRVLHLGKYYVPERGGIETVLEALCRGTTAALDSRALVMHTEPRTVHEAVDGVLVTRVASFGRVGAVSLTPSLAFWLSRASADVVVLHEPNPMALVACTLAPPDVPLVVWFHSEVVRPRWRYRLFYEPFLNRVLARAACIVVSAPPMQDVPALARHRDKVTVLPFGLDPAGYPVQPLPAPRTGQLPTVLFVGRLVAYKGVDVLLRAMVDVPASLVLVGDGPLRQSLEQLARDLGIDDRITFAGRVSDADRLAWFGRADVVALPSVSRQEAFGMVQVEAMLTGRPVVSTSLPTGVPWVNQHGESGLVVPPGDSAALAGALRLLFGDPDLRARLGEGGRARANRLFTAERMCAEFASLCRGVAVSEGVETPAQAVEVQ
jgi:rhamnosyl/mannosyltransferase